MKIHQHIAETFLEFSNDVEKEGVTLSKPLINRIANKLNLLSGVGLKEVSELDAVPYEVAPFYADKVHWISRRFRNSGGWEKLQ